MYVVKFPFKASRASRAIEFKSIAPEDCLALKGEKKHQIISTFDSLNNKKYK